MRKARGAAAHPRGDAATAGASATEAGELAALLEEYDFLIDTLTDRTTLAHACGLARRWEVTPQQVLFAKGWVRSIDYVRALAERCGVEMLTPETAHRLVPPSPRLGPRACLRTGLLRLARGSRSRIAVSPANLRPARLGRALPRLGADLQRVSFIAPESLRTIVARTFAARLTATAIHGLSRRFPGDSAETGATLAQRVVLGGLAIAFISLAIAAPATTLRTATLGLALVFLPVIALRIAAAIDYVLRARRHRPAPREPDANLPVYTLLVPLYDEHQMVANITEALQALDYPAAKLDIKLIFEAVDARTLEAAKALDLPEMFEFIVVPDVGPRTKPKALNYALQFARGDYVAIYDAEDRPDPDQLRRALAAFRRGPANLACLQARLSFYNGDENWLTKQFTLEYSALFDALLPALQRLRLPIPLGGTSNHFRMSALRWLGAWDAFNVTEDADLGMRLYRRGYVCQVLDSTTWEEANCRLGNWVRQRTRWLKGWMQTYIVHMRHPVRLWRELGARGFCGFQIVIGGPILAALVHPLVYVLVLHDTAQGTFFDAPTTFLTLQVWLVAAFGLSTGYAASMALSALAASGRGFAKLAPHVVWMPVYWVLLSMAAYRALYQLVRAPFLWEKTAHGLSARFAETHAKKRHAELARRTSRAITRQ